MFNINKKGMFYEVGLVIFALLVLSTSLYNILTTQSETINIGKTSSNLIALDKESDLKLNLAEQAALFSIYNSIIESSGNSGFSKNEILIGCKFWNRFKETCKLDKETLLNNLKDHVERDFNKYALNEKLDIYKIEIKEEKEKLIFTFESNVKFSKNEIEYKINHKFQKEINYNLKNIISLIDIFSKEISIPPDLKCEEFKKDLEEFKEINCADNNKDYLAFTFEETNLNFNNKLNSLEYPSKPIIRFNLQKIHQAETKIS